MSEPPFRIGTHVTDAFFTDRAPEVQRVLRAMREGWLAELAAGLAPSVVITFDAETGAPRIVFGAERRSADRDEQRRSIEQVIEALAKETAEGTSVAVVLDEFQAIRRFGGEEAEWHLRDLMQRHGDLSFVCAGSEVSLVEEMLGRERASSAPSSSSTVAVAVDALEKRGILVRVGEDRTIRFDSPFVRRWVAWETLDDVPGAGI